MLYKDVLFLPTLFSLYINELVQYICELEL